MAPSETTMSSRGLSLILLVSLLAAFACSNSGQGSADVTATCTVIDASTTCNTPMPSYQNDIVPILNVSCNAPCHSNESSGPWPLTAYDDVLDWASIIQNDVATCAMPPAADAGNPSNGPLTDSERNTLLNWIACGAPNN
jgi:hypothetical protein